MKTESISTIKKELKHLSKEDLLELCLRLGRFKKDNKALLTYLLFNAYNEDGYVASVKLTINELFEDINTDSYFYMKKTIRKILRKIKVYSQYSLKKSTEIELLIHFCECLNELKPSIHRNKVLSKLYERQVTLTKKKIVVLHEDLQHDYSLQLEALKY